MFKMLAIPTIILFLGLHISTVSTLTVNTSQPSTSLNAAHPNMCPIHQWMFRDCVHLVSMTRWRDVCYGPTYQYSSCPDYFLCSDIVDARGDKTIKCVPINQDGNASPRSTDLDPQIGTSPKKSGDGAATTNLFGYAVTIANDMSASVAAVFVSTDHTFIVKPKNNIVGKIRGKGVKVCEGNPECRPNANYDFKKGDIIDFTWGVSGGLHGSLVYTIWASQ